MDYTLERFPPNEYRYECAHFILNIHYAKTWPSVSHAFGLILKNQVVGGITYGTPSSAPLRVGICGPKFKGDLLELNRLCLYDNLKNEASFLVGKSLRMLRPLNKIIVSYADISQGHVGKVYQATNFLYCGLSAKRTDWRIRGKEHLHGQTVADEFRGVEDRAQAMRDKYGEDFYTTPRPRKHRYVTFVGTKAFKKSAKKALKYPIEPYPKG